MTLSSLGRGTLLALAAGGSLLLWGASPARADFEMQLADGSGNRVIIDGTTGTISKTGTVTVKSWDTSTPGLITFNGAVGKFNVNVSTGESKPLYGTPDEGGLDLSSLDTSTSGGGNLTLTLADTDFPAQLGPYEVSSSIGGTIKTNDKTQAATITAQAWANPGNLSILPGGSVPAGSVPVFPPPAFSFSTTSTKAVPFSRDSESSFNSNGGDYALFVQVSIAYGSHGGSASFDHSLDPVAPAPPGLVLALTGLPGLAFGWLRRRRAKHA